jgi:hypothetical protein
MRGSGDLPMLRSTFAILIAACLATPSTSALAHGAARAQSADFSCGRFEKDGSRPLPAQSWMRLSCGIALSASNEQGAIYCDKAFAAFFEDRCSD